MALAAVGLRLILYPLSHDITRPHRLDWDLNIGSMPYGVMLRRNRRWLQAPLFDKASLRQFLPLQARTAKTLLLNLLNDPDNFRAHLHRCVCLTIHYLSGAVPHPP